MEQYLSRTPFVSGKTKAMITIGLLLLGIVISIVSIILGFYLTVFQPQGAYIGGIDSAEVGLGTFIIGLQGLTLVSELPIIILTVIFFLIWLHHATKNLDALDAVGDYSPGWAVGWWFIPFANLVVPYRVVKDVWEKSDPNIIEETDYWHSFSPGLLFGGWWAFWLLSRFVGRASGIYANKLETTEQWFVLTKIIMVFDFLSVIAALLCILIVLGIDKRQEARSKGLNSSESAMPLPPVFQQTL